MTRLEKLTGKIADRADGIIVTSEINQEYLTEFPYTDGYVLVTKQKSYLITDFRYKESAEACADKEYSVVVFDGGKYKTLDLLLKENSVKRLMFEDRVLPFAEYENMKKNISGVEFIPAGNIIESIREYKSEKEIDCIIKAQRIAEKSLDTFFGEINLNMTEREAAAYLEYLMKKNGAMGISFDTIAVSGQASSLPHGRPRDVKLEKGFLTIDFGAVYNGYHSDMTRTVCIGKADEEMRKIYNTVLESQKRAIDAVMCGERNCFGIDRVAREYIYGNGYRGCFGHGLGHGVGLEIHEAPRLSPLVDSTKMLECGHVVTVEPGIYIEGKYGVRIEDMIYIGEKEAINITKMPKKLIEI